LLFLLQLELIDSISSVYLAGSGMISFDVLKMGFWDIS